MVGKDVGEHVAVPKDHQIIFPTPLLQLPRSNIETLNPEQGRVADVVLSQQSNLTWR